MDETRAEDKASAENVAEEKINADGAAAPETVRYAKPYEGQIRFPGKHRIVSGWRYHVGHFAVSLGLRLTCGMQCVGLENIPDEGPAIIACNHRAYLDPPLIGASVRTRQVYFLAKKELQKIPVVGFILNDCCIWVDRKAKDGKSMDVAVKMLDEGRLVCIFPEGTRSKTDKLLPGRSGVAILALHSGAPIIPAAVYNTAQVMAKKCMWGSGPAKLRFGKPIYFERDDNPTPAKIRAVRAEVMSYIAELLQQGM